MKQSYVFKNGEADAWYKRNAGKIEMANDPVMVMLAKGNIMPLHALEVGCADGWRLPHLENIGCVAEGIDPISGASPGVIHGTADDLRHWEAEFFDLVIYGFCLYLCDPEDYFQIVKEGDRVLEDGGHLVIHDFCESSPYRVPYKHYAGVFSHHMDFAKLWLAHPAYSMKLRVEHDGIAVTILKKNLAGAFPGRE